MLLLPLRNLGQAGSAPAPTITAAAAPPFASGSLMRFTGTNFGLTSGTAVLTASPTDHTTGAVPQGGVYVWDDTTAWIACNTTGLTSGTYYLHLNSFANGWSATGFAVQVVTGAAVSVRSFWAPADWFTSGATYSTFALWEAGDEVLVFGGTENSNVILGTPTVSGLTFTLVTSSTTAGEAGVYWWRATAASGGSGNIVSTRSGSSGMAGLAVWVVQGSPTVAALAGNNTEAAYNQAVGRNDLTIVALVDFLASTPAKTPATGSGTATERFDTGNGTNYGVWAADWVGASAGTFNFGPNNYTSLQVAQAGVRLVAPTGPQATVVGSFSSSSNYTSQSTGSFTPAANSKLVVIAAAFNNNHATPHSFTVSGGGLTWAAKATSAELETGFGADYDLAATVWWADVGSSPASMSVTVDPWATADLGFIGIIAFQVTGLPTGAGFDIQPTVFGIASGGSATVALASARTAGSAILAGWFAVNAAAPTWPAPPDGWLSLVATSTGLISVHGLVSLVDPDGSLALGYTSGSAINAAGVLIEVGTPAAGAVQFGASLPSALAVTGAATRTARFAAGVTGPLAVTGAATRTAELVATLAGPLTATAAATRTAELSASLTGPLASTGAGTKSTAFAATLSAALATTGAATRRAEFAAALAGPLATTGAATRTARFAAALSSPLATTGASTRTAELSAALTAALATTGAGSSARQFAAALTAGLVTTGAATRTTRFAASLSGPAASTGAATRVAEFQATLSGALATTGAGSSAQQFAATLAAALATTGAATRTARFVATLTGPLATTAAATRTARLTASLTAPLATSATGTTSSTAAFQAALTAPLATTGAATRTAELASALSAPLATTGAGTRRAEFAAALTGPASSTAAATTTVRLSATLTAPLATSASAGSGVKFQSALASPLTVTAAGSRVAELAAALTGPLSTTGAGTKRVEFQASLSAGATATGSGSVEVRFAASLIAALLVTAYATNASELRAPRPPQGDGLRLASTAAGFEILGRQFSTVSSVTGMGRRR